MNMNNFNNVNYQAQQHTGQAPAGNSPQAGQNKPQREERAYSALWFQKTTDGTPSTLKVRVLHNDVSEFLETSTHWVKFTKKNGGQGNIRVECLKQGTFGDVRDSIFCPLDALEKYGEPAKRQWFWVQDMEDGGLKYVEMPYTIRRELESLQFAYLQGKPLHSAVFQLIKSGKGMNTTYQVVPDPNHQIEPFDLQGFLNGLGLQTLPALVGDRDFPPIWRLSPEQTQDVAQGIMPWQKPQNTYDPTGGNQQGVNNNVQGNMAQGGAQYNPGVAAQAPQTAFSGNMQGGHQQPPVGQPDTNVGGQQAPNQGNVTAPQAAPQNVAEQGAPNLGTVQSDPLPESFGTQEEMTPYQEHTPNVPYNQEGKQEEVDEVDDIEDIPSFF